MKLCWGLRGIEYIYYENEHVLLFLQFLLFFSIGFWKIATRKASERQEEEAYNRKLLREQKEQRQRTVLFDLYAEQEKESNNKKETTTLR